MKTKAVNFIRSVHSICTALGITAYLFAGELMAGGLPTSGEDVLPDGVTGDNPSGAILGLVSWGAQFLAYALMLGAVVAGGYAIVTSFGEANSTKGGWGKFLGILVGSIVMIAVVVALGLVAVNWAQGLSSVTISGA